MTDRETPTDHATRSVTMRFSLTMIVAASMRLSSYAEQRNRRQQTSLRPRYGIAHLAIYFLNVSPVNAKLTSPSYTVAIVTPTISVILPINYQISRFLC